MLDDTPPIDGADDSAASTEFYVISVAAELAGMHAQTLRNYDRLGLVTPRRTQGGGRRYTPADVRTLREIQRLSQQEGVNLAGIKAIIELTRTVDRLAAENRELRRRLEDQTALLDARDRSNTNRGGELVHVPRSRAVVVWRPRHLRQ